VTLKFVDTFCGLYVFNIGGGDDGSEQGSYHGVDGDDSDDDDVSFSF
jgi:hypothetical protein